LQIISLDPINIRLHEFSSDRLNEPRGEGGTFLSSYASALKLALKAQAPMTEVMQKRYYFHGFP
jgi:hypothetical protein